MKKNSTTTRKTAPQKKSVLLFGAGNLASNITELLEKNNHTILGYISTETPGTVINNYPVLGDISFFQKADHLHKEYCHIAIGENSVRHSLFKAIDIATDRLLTIIAETSYVSTKSTVGSGTYISHRAVIQGNVHIGMCCIIDTGVIIEHHCSIGDFVNISPGVVVCGTTKIHNGVIIGAGSTIIEKVEIGEHSLIGAGSVVVNDIGPNSVAVGNPARVIKQRSFSDTYLK
ncbi:MAG TPA: acetyltransferase [Deltaproteobacteria bacterium]|nr:acetyltransferase [Deltaproteobacteria bacterium]